MTDPNTGVPVHESLEVGEATDIYRTDEWWKSVVTYRFQNASEAKETAVYLWHRDEEWTRKNKYVVKTPEGWATDREIIDRYLQRDPPTSVTTAFPVNEYYTVADGETVFRDDDWWKAIVNVVEKGSYETNEAMVYLWQNREGEWRRRQKYTIKTASDWEDERAIIDERLDISDDTDEGTSGSDGRVSSELSTLSDELDAHLSGEFK